MMTRHLTSTDAYTAWRGVRVRAIWNPETKLWFIYDFESDSPVFSISTLELHTVAVYGELKPKFAPDGSPSFVGTIADYEIVDRKKATRVKAHPYAPSKLYFDKTPIIEFDFCRRLLLDGAKMFADVKRTRGITK